MTFGQSRRRNTLVTYEQFNKALSIVKNVPCQNAPDLYFPDPNDRSGAKLAIQQCNNCLLMNMCRQYAIDNREQFGIWGGLTTSQREQLTPRRGTAARTAALV